jgi:hypothetical protein
MSGAISAGAYTAGVLDFLIQALDEWEKALEVDKDGKLPNHLVGLKVMAGASAGGITAAIGAIALVDGGNKPGAATDAKGQRFPYHLKKLYDTWVVKPTLVAEAGETEDLLSLSDLKDIDNQSVLSNLFSHTSDAATDYRDDTKDIVSLLNTSVLDQIAANAINVSSILTPPRRFVANTLHVYMTLTNLRGVPYQVPFSGGDYYMISHGDRVHYALANAGAWNTKEAQSEFGTIDAKRDIDVNGLPPGAPKGNIAWRDYSICALATAAFPVGLSPRIIGSDPIVDYSSRRFPSNDLVYHAKAIRPDWPKTVLAPLKFGFTAADGGIIDNDPFEFAHFAVKEEGKLDQPLRFNPNEVERAVIMISPFPEQKPIRPEGQPRRDIVSLASSLFPSLIDQARFKPDALAMAAEEEHASRYLIGPSRVIKGSDGKEVLQRYGIASGLLGGFGGFVSRAFRDHDFQLGRRNCQRFLKTNFALPDANPVIGSWTAGGRAVEKERYIAKKGAGGAICYSLVPCLGSAEEEVLPPAWPRITAAEFDVMQDRIARRFDAIAPRFLDQYVKGILGFLIGLALLPVVSRTPGLIRDRLLKSVRLKILADLVRRNQIEDWDIPAGLPLDNDDVRLILAELLSPDYDQRSVAGIFKSIAPFSTEIHDSTTIEAVLNQLKGADGNCKVWEAPWRDKKNNRLFTLASRRPGLAEGLLGGRWGLMLKPNVDPPGV